MVPFFVFRSHSSNNQKSVSKLNCMETVNALVPEPIHTNHHRNRNDLEAAWRMHA